VSLSLPDVTGSHEAVPRAVTGVALGPCVRCARPIPVDARFCDGCGAPQRKACSGCGNSLPMNARFCSHCGTPQGG
jgi:predicted nucleic acid-binding Zn ribbon protein